jgi:hypothetical protein
MKKTRPGWICLHRKILDDEQFKDPDALALWMHLLLRANYEKSTAKIGNRQVNVNRGQLICGRKSLSLSTGIQESKIERLLKRWKNEHQLEQQSFSKFRLITITSYDKYQNGEQQNDEKMNTLEQVNNTPLIKPSNNDLEFFFKQLGLNEAHAKDISIRFLEYYEDTGWKYADGEIVGNWKVAARRWRRRENDSQFKRFNSEPGNEKTKDDTAWIDKL